MSPLEAGGVEAAIDALAARPNDLTGDDFLLSWERSAADLDVVLRTAELLRAIHAEGVSVRSFESGLALSIFRDQSTRTRYPSSPTSTPRSPTR